MPTNKLNVTEQLVASLRKRAEIRRQIPNRKSVLNGEPDRIADLLEEAADALAMAPAVSETHLDSKLSVLPGVENSCTCMGTPSCGDGAFEAQLRRTCPVHGVAAQPSQPVSAEAVKNVFRLIIAHHIYLNVAKGRDPQNGNTIRLAREGFAACDSALRAAKLEGARLALEAAANCRVPTGSNGDRAGRLKRAIRALSPETVVEGV